ncbi:hypothetical protein NP493_1190g00022 [Ridgeia piscesae]|uniref:Uncharacterized protein n=1 Tax=Ridgeia piscesae TaxID=27915 RepID=A0AAD9NGR5_RIDPI|nr:hypothetical protein NP493_1190g00022 [Ridgeia piscesae]
MAKSDRRLKEATDRVTKLEESIVGKQTALECLIEENESLKQQLDMASTSPVKQIEPCDPGSQTGPGARGDEANAEIYSQKLRDVEAELMQRDTVIKQLSDKLQATVENRDLLQAEYMEQAAQLSSQVQLLQQQLKQTSEWLKTESGGRGISAQALLEAKNELLALQQINRRNEGELHALRQAVAQRDQALLQRDQSLHQIAEKMTYMTNYCKLLESEKETLLKTAQSGSVTSERSQL